MRRVSTLIGGLVVSVEIHPSPSPEGPGAGVAITGSMEGAEVAGTLQDLFSRGMIATKDGDRQVRVPEPLIAEIDDWCMQYLF